MVNNTHRYARKAIDFVGSIGVNSSIHVRAETLEQTISCTKYTGIRWFRTGYEGGISVEDLMRLNAETGAKISYGLLSGGSDIERLIRGAEELARAGSLLALEGPNEPNNWSIKYNGREGGRNLSWVPVAELQRDLYVAVKSNPVLKAYPVFSIGGESGAQTDNAGLQYLTVPESTDALMPEGTQYADYANVHNYFCHPSLGGVIDNMTWHAADPTLETVPDNGGTYDNLYGNYGKMWGGGKFMGYTKDELEKLPRVTTETGVQVGAYDGAVDEEMHGRMIVCMYLSQFARRFNYTALYLLRDRTDESGNQQFGLYKPDYTPRKAAIYLHNLTTVLHDVDFYGNTGYLGYSVLEQPETVHTLLLQKSSSAFCLVVWGERFAGGEDEVTVMFECAHDTVNIYDVTQGTEVVQVLRDITSFSYTLSDHPVVFEVIN